jgi:hypothetical protein
MSNSHDKAAQPSEEAAEAFAALQSAVHEAIDRKRRLGQYWVVTDAEGQPVRAYPENSVDSAAE